MSLFKCDTCAEKDLRINDLRDQIQMLRKMVHTGDTSAAPSFFQQEADQIISGSNDSIDVTPEDEDQREAYAILSGAYDSNQVEVI